MHQVELRGETGASALTGPAGAVLRLHPHPGMSCSLVRSRLASKTCDAPGLPLEAIYRPGQTRGRVQRRPPQLSAHRTKNEDARPASLHPRPLAPPATTARQAERTPAFQSGVLATRAALSCLLRGTDVCTRTEPACQHSVACGRVQLCPCPGMLQGMLILYRGGGGSPSATAPSAL